MKLALGGLVLTTAAGLLAGAAAYGPARFTELDVERINLYSSCYMVKQKA